VLGWIALAVVATAGAYVVIRLVRSWGVAGRRYGGEGSSSGGAPSPGDEPPAAGPPDRPGPGPG